MDRPVAVFLVAAVLCGPVVAQKKAEKSESLAKLELSMEIAATDDDGYPSALRITITNVGGVPVDLPFKEACSPDNGYLIRTGWVPDEPTGRGYGEGYGCGFADGPNLRWRIEHEWVRLRPGDFLTATERLRWTRHDEDGPGTVEYWVEYDPPYVTPAEFSELSNAGYIIPTEEVTTEHMSFHVR